MIETSAAYRAALRRSHRAVVVVDVLRDGVVIETLTAVPSAEPRPGVATALSGTVTLDAKAASRGRFELTVVDDGTLGMVPLAAASLLAPYGNEVRIGRGIRLADGRVEAPAIGIFRIDRANVEDTPAGLLIQLSGLDRSAAVIDARFEEPYEVAAGTLIEEAIVTLVQFVYPDVVTHLPGVTFTTPLVRGEEQGDRWKMAQDLGAAAGLEVYFDRAGELRIVPAPALGGEAVTSIVEGEGGLLLSASRGWTREGARNAWIVTGSNTGIGAPVRGTAYDLDPTSPTFYGGRFGKAPEFYESPFISTTDQANAVAQAMLERQLGTTQTVDFGTIVDAALEPGDIARITRLRAGIDEDHIIESLTIPLSVDQPMTGATRATRSIDFTPSPPPGGGGVGGGGGGGAEYPSRLRALGRTIVDETDAVVSLLVGPNMHTTFPIQDIFAAVSAEANGRVFSRGDVRWDRLEPTEGDIDATVLGYVDDYVAACEAAGWYTMLECHLNTGQIPAWADTGVDETASYVANAAYMTAFLAHRYGNESSPQYTKAVVGFGLNEPPLSNTRLNRHDAIPVLEDAQRTMIDWVRSEAPDWIGFVALAYANQNPFLTGTGADGPSRISADPAAYDSVGGNVVFDGAHHYSFGCTTSDPDDDGRQANGTPYPTYQDGGRLLTQTGTNSLTFVDDSIRLSQMAAFFAPIEEFCALADWPLMIGEWGTDFVHGTNVTTWTVRSFEVIDAGVNAAIILGWMGTLQLPEEDVWTLVPGGTVESWFAALLSRGA